MRKEENDNEVRTVSSISDSHNSDVSLVLKPASPKNIFDGKVEQFTSSALASTLKKVQRSGKASPVVKSDDKDGLERLHSTSTNLSKQMREGDDMKITFNPVSVTSTDKDNGLASAMTSKVVVREPSPEQSPKRVVLSKQYAHI